jgi:hypothetical protein
MIDATETNIKKSPGNHCGFDAPLLIFAHRAIQSRSAKRINTAPNAPPASPAFNHIDIKREKHYRDADRESFERGGTAANPVGG